MPIGTIWSVRPMVDHHVHFLATVAARLSVDVSGCRSVAEVVDCIRTVPGRGWVRAWGYEEWLLAEGRHPTISDLDLAQPGRPVVLHHRSGHAAVVNSTSARHLGLSDAGDGLVVDRPEDLAGVPRLPPGEMEAAASEVSRRWAAAGIGAFVDATHTNGPAEIETLDAWGRRGVVVQEVTAMVAEHQAAGLPGYGRRVGGVTLGHVKLMPDRDPGKRLGPRIAGAHRGGWPVAVHVVEIDVLDEVLNALESSPAPAGTYPRIEHNALCLPEQVARVAASGARVVVNPSFLLRRGGKYRREIGPVEFPWLIRMRSLIQAGIPVRAGSDSPVTEPVPEDVMAAATCHPFSPDESLSASDAESLLSSWDTDHR